MQCILSRWFGHWRTESRQGAAPPPPTAPEAVVDNLRCHQRRLSWHHGNSRPSVDVLRVGISAKANLPLSQIPPPRRRDAWNATSVVLSSLDFSCPCGRAPTCQNRSWTGLMLTASDRYWTRRWPVRIQLAVPLVNEGIWHARIKSMIYVLGETYVV